MLRPEVVYAGSKSIYFMMSRMNEYLYAARFEIPTRRANKLTTLLYENKSINESIDAAAKYLLRKDKDPELRVIDEILKTAHDRVGYEKGNRVQKKVIEDKDEFFRYGIPLEDKKTQKNGLDSALHILLYEDRESMIDSRLK